jgi:hypothetical protein
MLWSLSVKDGQQGHTLLAFLTTSCAPCFPFWKMLSAPSPETTFGVRVVVITPSSSMESERAVAQLTPAGTQVHMSSSTWFAFGVSKAPSFVLVQSLDEEGDPWDGHARVLGQASVDLPGELADLVRSWQAEDGRPSP